ncbi:MAG: hypothetical protein U0R24_08680 [Solirubrobacterales bacterium]
MGRRTLIVTLLCAALLATLPAAAMAGGKVGGKSSCDGKAKLQRKIGWGPLSDRRAARCVERTPETLRPENAVPNATVPTDEQLAYFHANSDMPYQRWVDGQYSPASGSTDDIIEWAANKWGLPEDVLRAVAVHESWWEMSTLGDNGDSFGIFQVRRPYHCCLPFTRDSTAFNADYYGGIMRAYYDGKMTWLNNPDVRPENGRTYRAGDLWGSIGAWVSGRWYTAQNAEYVDWVKFRLQERTWETDPWFPTNP